MIDRLLIVTRLRLQHFDLFLRRVQDGGHMRDRLLRVAYDLVFLLHFVESRRQLRDLLLRGLCPLL